MEQLDMYATVKDLDNNLRAMLDKGMKDDEIIVDLKDKLRRELEGHNNDVVSRVNEKMANNNFTDRNTMQPMNIEGALSDLEQSIRFKLEDIRNPKEKSAA